MHDSKVGVVALYKISACLLCTFLAFLKTCCLMLLSTILDILCYIHIKWDPNITKMINQIITNNIKPIFMNIY